MILPRRLQMSDRFGNVHRVDAEDNIQDVVRRQEEDQRIDLGA